MAGVGVERNRERVRKENKIWERKNAKRRKNGANMEKNDDRW